MKRKKTTYLMLVAMVAGLIGAMAATGLLMHDRIIVISRYTLGGEQVNIVLEPVHKVAFDDNSHGTIFRIDNYKGFAIQESDTARMTTLHTRAGWKPFLDCSTDSGLLTVKVNYNAMVREYVDSCMPRRSVRLSSEDFVIATVIMPRGTLREVAANDKSVYLDSVRADEIISMVEDRLVLNNSHIKVLDSRAKKINELKLADSTVGTADFDGVSGNFKVTCEPDVSVIDKMYVDSVYKNPRRAYFKFEKANIRDFKFNPERSMLLNVDMKSGSGNF